MLRFYSVCCVLQDVVLSFTARQQGTFHVCQRVDVLGHVVKKSGSKAEDFTGLKFCSFHTITLHLSAVCRSETTHPVPKLNPGEYLKINLCKKTKTNNVGLSPKMGFCLKQSLKNSHRCFIFFFCFFKKGSAICSNRIPGLFWSYQTFP